MIDQTDRLKLFDFCNQASNIFFYLNVNYIKNKGGNMARVVYQNNVGIYLEYGPWGTGSLHARVPLKRNKILY